MYHIPIILQGGAEHGVPILVSDLQTGKPAHSCGLLRIGDAILSVNGHNLRNCHHKDAVTVLQSVGEEVVMEVAYIADLVSDNSDDEGEHHQQRQQPLITRDSSMPPQNEVDSLNSASSESEYDSPDSSVEPDHITSVPTTLLPTSTLPVSSTSLPVTSNSLPVTSASIPASSASLPASSASVLCKPRRAGTQQHKLMASFGATPHNGLQDSRVMAHPDDLSDENSNFNNNSVSANGGAAQYANYANYYTDNPYATVVSAIELGPSDIPKGKSKPARV